jgi:hypothetical protein
MRVGDATSAQDTVAILTEPPTGLVFLENLLAIVPVRRAKLDIQFYRQGGPTYIVAAGLLGG